MDEFASRALLARQARQLGFARDVAGGKQALLPFHADYPPVYAVQVQGTNMISVGVGTHTG